jgi:hypothetical protein
MPFGVSMQRVSHTPNRAASIHLARVVSYLHRAGQQLTAATHTAPNRYHQQQLRRLIVDLRELSSPIAGLASVIARGGDR